MDIETDKQEKPIEIIELEKATGIIFVSSEANFKTNIGPHSYSLNSNGKVNGISIINNQISDVEVFNKLTDLEYLNLTRNRIEDVSSILTLPFLKYLYLGGNGIKDLNPILKEKNLLELIIWNNPISDFSLVKQLKKLQGLYCQNANISDITFIEELKHLKKFYADENRIIEISVLLLLDGLTSVNLIGNLIKEIPLKVAEKYFWLKDSLGDGFPMDNGLFISGNPLTFPPISVIELGPDTVKNYYETAEEYGHAPLSEGRILFVGDGSSGKSSIIERILYNTFLKGRVQTNGVKLEHFHLQHSEDQRDLVFHVWDFGGQEIQHAVHKFFFTEGCLYVLVLDNRKEEEPEYWLQQIESLGGKAPVMVVFNKQDENAAETVDRKYLKEKYPNIVGYYNTSCDTGFGINDFKRDLERYAIQLRTVEEQFPKNWFTIKKLIQQCTSNQHFLSYDSYKVICRQNHVERDETQKLLLKYLTTIGAVTWFGDTYLNFMHVLSPAWITQGVYKIITAKKTAHFLGQINISDFKELLQPTSELDYTYSDNHYGYILSMMKKFDLCYTPDDKTLLIPSAFGKAPKMEYSDFRGEEVRTYVLHFKDYMPLALIHRYISINLPEAFDNNCWYSGIVTKDPITDSLAMVHADKEAKRIYVRIKGSSPLGMWEHIRRVFYEITSSYANIRYHELVALNETAENTVDYEDLISHLQANKAIYFHSKLKQDFNVGYLMGLFESKEVSIQKIEKGELRVQKENSFEHGEKIPPLIINILNNNSPTVNASVNTLINIDIDIQIVHSMSNDVKGEANYLIEALGDSNKILSDLLAKVIQFADDAKSARNSGEVKEKGWGRRLKGILQTLSGAGEQFKNIQDGSEAFQSLLKGIVKLAQQVNLKDIGEMLGNVIS